jgi:hypothetical protein
MTAIDGSDVPAMLPMHLLPAGHAERPPAGLSVSPPGTLLPTEPLEKRAVVFVDGQNLFYGVREAFGYTHPNYDVAALAGPLAHA